MTIYQNVSNKKPSPKSLSNPETYWFQLSESLLGQGALLKLKDGHIHTAIFEMDNQQGPTIQHMELCSCSVAAWMEGEFRGDGYMYTYG